MRPFETKYDRYHRLCRLALWLHERNLKGLKFLEINKKAQASFSQVHKRLQFIFQKLNDESI